MLEKWNGWKHREEKQKFESKVNSLEELLNILKEEKEKIESKFKTEFKNAQLPYNMPPNTTNVSRLTVTCYSEKDIKNQIIFLQNEIDRQKDILQNATTQEDKNRAISWMKVSQEAEKDLEDFLNNQNTIIVKINKSISVAESDILKEKEILLRNTGYININEKWNQDRVKRVFARIAVFFAFLLVLKSGVNKLKSSEKNINPTEEKVDKKPSQQTPPQSQDKKIDSEKQKENLESEKKEKNYKKEYEAENINEKIENIDKYLNSLCVEGGKWKLKNNKGELVFSTNTEEKAQLISDIYDIKNQEDLNSQIKLWKEKKITERYKDLKERGIKDPKKVSEKKNESEVEDGGEKSTKITQFVWERKKIEEKEEVKEKNFDYRNQPYYDYENGKINNQKFISIVRDPNNGSITTEFKGRKFYFKNDWEKRQFEIIINNLK